MLSNLILSSPQSFASSLLMMIVIWLILSILVFVWSLVHFGHLIHYENEYSFRMVNGSMRSHRSRENTIKEAWQTTEYISTAIGIIEMLLYLIILLIG